MSMNIAGIDEALKNWCNTNQNTMISNIIFDEDVVNQLFTVQTGATGATVPITLLNTSIELGDGLACGFQDAGTDTITDRLITLGYAKVNKSFCPKELLKSYLSTELKVAAGMEKMPFEEKFTNELIAKINQERNRQLLIGKTESGDKINGILTTIEKDVESGVITNVVDKASDTVDVRVEKLWKMIKPEHSNSEIYMSIQNFKELVLIYQKQNLYNFDVKQNNSDFEMTLPFTTMKIRGLASMGNNDTIWASEKWNLVYATDGENDNETIDMFWDKSAQDFKFICNFNFGVNYAIADAIYVNGTPMA